jgi:hypothetical protein
VIGSSFMSLLIAVSCAINTSLVIIANYPNSLELVGIADFTYLHQE